MYMFTQKESQYTARLLWHDWFPSVWLDEHQMGSSGARIFVMPATDPINPNVHPLIYRWNGILGQSQAAALEAAGKDGIIYNSTYTNFWEGRDGVERLVAQPDRPADRSGERAHRGADRAAARGPGAPAPARGPGRRARSRGPRTGGRFGGARSRRRPTSTRAPSIRAPGWAAAGRSATSSTTS